MRGTSFGSAVRHSDGGRGTCTVRRQQRAAWSGRRDDNSHGDPVLSDVAGAPWWVWVGGLLGAFYVAASIILTPRLGAANTVTLIIAGQVLASMVLDQFGLLSLPV